MKKTLQRKEFERLWSEVKGNFKKLGLCNPPHNFQVDNIKGVDRRQEKRYTCRKCGGKINNTNYDWYTIGIEHGFLSLKKESNGDKKE